MDKQYITIKKQKFQYNYLIRVLDLTLTPLLYVTLEKMIC